MKGNKEQEQHKVKSKQQSYEQAMPHNCTTGLRENRAALPWQRGKQISGTPIHLMISLATAPASKSRSKMDVIRADHMSLLFPQKLTLC